LIGRLDAIAADRRCDMRRERELVALETLQQMALERSGARDFAASIRHRAPAIIAEIKRRSPSAGPIDVRCDATEAARQYEQGGAAAVSVVTEPRCFGGTFLDLARARRGCALPVLCKDFITCDFHLWKAAAFGADAVLLIAAILDDRALGALLTLAAAIGIAAVVEVHDQTEALRAGAAGAGIVGINNRNLKTFEVDLQTTPRVRGMIPDGTLVIAESGYRNTADIQSAAACGVHAILVGEHLLRSGERMQAVRALVEAACSG
jgi:indole-3-glycerol phosphate synthase